jgi:hypothetical protein
MAIRGRQAKAAEASGGQVKLTGAGILLVTGTFGSVALAMAGHRLITGNELAAGVARGSWLEPAHGSADSCYRS